MATFEVGGLEGLALSLEQFAAIPDQVVKEMLDAGAAVVVRYHRAEISAQGLVKSGKLLGSVKAHPKSGSARNDWKRYVLIYPSGRHGTYHPRDTDGAKVVTNSEVGFIQAYGAPKKGIRATDWMSKANEKAAPAVEAAELAVYNRWLESLNL